MMNHHRLYENLNVQPFLEEINYDDWVGSNRGLYQPGEGWQDSAGWAGQRIDLIKFHKNPDDLEPNREGVKSLALSPEIQTQGSTYTGVRASKVFYNYPIVSGFLQWFKDINKCKIARVRYAKLVKGGSVLNHVDGGPYYDDKDRFHLIIQGKYEYTVDGEMQEYKEGELWWFDNKKLHGSYNHGDKDRIVLIFDVGSYKKIW